MSGDQTTRYLTPIARAIHEGLGPSWAYANYGGDEWYSMRAELMSAAASAWRVVAPEIERLLRIEKAAQDLAEILNGGFVVCGACGEQESTTDVDYARELLQHVLGCDRDDACADRLREQSACQDRLLMKRRP